MKISRRHAALLALLVSGLFALLSRADEPKVAIKKAAEEKPAQEQKAATKEEAKKPGAANDREVQIDAQVQQWIGQFTQQYRPMLNPELNFIRQVCDLAPEQRPKIKAAGEAGVKDAALKMAELQAGRMRGGFVANNAQPDPRRIIREALAKALQETLTSEQMAKYTEEATQRTALRKRAAVLSVVARLDATLCLTADQRDKISASISSGWQEKWEQWLMISMYGDQYFPNVPDQLVSAHLNADQKSVWTGIQKVEFGFSVRRGDGDDDGWWGDEPAKADAPAR